MYRQQLVDLASQLMIVGTFAFLVAALQAGGIKSSSIRRLISAKEVDGHAEVKVQVPLEGGQVYHTGLAELFHIVCP